MHTRRTFRILIRITKSLFSWTISILVLTQAPNHVSIFFLYINVFDFAKVVSFLLKEHILHWQNTFFQKEFLQQISQN